MKDSLLSGYEEVYCTSGDSYENKCEKTGKTQKVSFDDESKSVWIMISGQRFSARLTYDDIHSIYMKILEKTI